MMRGYSLEQDLRLLINNPKYSDVEILCGDGKKLHGCRVILAARSEVFDRLLYNGMKESYENQISFPEINSFVMEIILEYIYTGSIKEESVTENNLVEAFYASDYFQLPTLQNSIIKIVDSPELLSKVVETTSLTEDNILLDRLIETVAVIPLNSIEFNRLSIAGLQHLLSCTYEKEKPFATPEYEVFRYSAILAAKKVSNDAYKTLTKRLPTLEELGNSIQVIQVENKFIADHQKVAKELDPLVKFIDFRRIKTQILDDIIKPLEIVPTEIILNANRYNTTSNNSDLNYIRGSLYVWDESSCGSKLVIEDNGKVVHASDDCHIHQSVRTKTLLEYKGIFEWNVIIENDCDCIWVGVCASENFDYGDVNEHQSTEWVLGSNGLCYNSNNETRYCSSFGDGTIITVHLDTNKGALAFTVNGIKYSEVSEWDNLPSKLYPVVSLCYPGRIRIQPYRKT